MVAATLQNGTGDEASLSALTAIPRDPLLTQVPAAGRPLMPNFISVFNAPVRLLWKEPPVKIKRIEAVPCAIATHIPSSSPVGKSPALTTSSCVYTDDGVVGLADAPPRPYTYGETQESTVAIIDKIFAPQLTGIEIVDRERIHTRTAANHPIIG